MAAHRGAARRVGLRRARSSPTTGRCRSSPPCTGSPPTPADAGRAGAGRRHRRRAARHHRLRRRTGRAGAPRRAARGARRPGRPARCSRRRSSSGCSTRTGRRRRSVAGAADVDLDSPANRALARELAERSIVLLDAGTALPLLGDGRPLRRVAVVGPCADDPRTFMGCYAFPNHVLPRYPGLGLGIEVPTARRRPARRAAATSRSSTSRAARCSGDDRSGFAAAVAAARDADVCVALVGDLAGLFGHGTSGEGCDAEDLRLPGRAGRAARRAARHRHAGGRGRRLRPARTRWATSHGRAAGLVQAFMPGEEGGAAIAGVLSGRVQPGGKLPVQIPRRAGRPAEHLPAAAARRRRERRHQQPRPDAAVPVRLRPLLHHLRGRRPADQRDRGADRRRVHRVRARPQHRRAGRRGGRPALPARRASPR